MKEASRRGGGRKGRKGDLMAVAVSKGATFSEVARQFGTSVVNVLLCCRRRGIESPRAWRIAPANVHMDERKPR